MAIENEITLFRKTGTTLVYLASAEYTSKVLQERYTAGDRLYIHVKRDSGFIIVYNNNDTNHVVPLSMNDQEHILHFCKNER